jgi:hypothetical protein
VARTAAIVLIEPFEVPPVADDAFVAGWERARAFLAERGAARASVLHRALRADVTLRFVHTALVDSSAAWRDAVRHRAQPGADTPFPAHGGLYATDAEDGEPDGAGGVLLISPSEVPGGDEERFAAAWGAVQDLLAPRQGYLGSRLHRAIEPGGYSFVPVVRWSSPLMYARALQQPEIERAIAALPVPTQPALYLRHGGPA